MSDRRIEDLGDDLAVPRKNGELVFEAPWEGRVFGMAVALSDDQLYAWDDFRDRLVAEIAAAEAHGDASGYYERWLASFERLLLDTRRASPPRSSTRRTAEYAAGVYDEHEHYETTSDAIASLTRSPHTSAVRNIVWRADGEPINVFRRPGQLFVCATGCCCGHTERGHAPVPVDLYHREWARRRIRHKVHLSLGRLPRPLRALERGAAALRRPPDLVPLDRRRRAGDRHLRLHRSDGPRRSLPAAAARPRRRRSSMSSTGRRQQLVRRVPNRRTGKRSALTSPRANRRGAHAVDNGDVRQTQPKQNADKFRACARAPSASALPPASGIAPVRVWRTVNVHPPCPVVNTLKKRSSTERRVIEDRQVTAAVGAGVFEAV